MTGSQKDFKSVTREQRRQLMEQKVRSLHERKNLKYPKQNGRKEENLNLFYAKEGEEDLLSLLNRLFFGTASMKRPISGGEGTKGTPNHDPGKAPVRERPKWKLSIAQKRTLVEESGYCQETRESRLLGEEEQRAFETRVNTEVQRRQEKSIRNISHEKDSRVIIQNVRELSKQEKKRVIRSAMLWKEILGPPKARR